jgi:hypothetical protein
MPNIFKSETNDCFEINFRLEFETISERIPTFSSHQFYKY